jgi:hypothetical protein
MGDKEAQEFEKIVSDAVGAEDGAWKKVGDMGDTWDFETDKAIEGLYIGKQDEVGVNKSTIYNIERSDNNEVMGVWDTTVLRTKMSQVPVGHEVRIEYKGKAKSDKSGKEYHDFDVYSRPPVMRKV